MLQYWLPNVASAAADLSVLKNFILKVEVVILNPVIKLGFAITLVIFLYGIFEFIKNAESSDARKLGGQHILWGVVGMFIMVAAGGIMQLVCASWGMADPNSCNPF
ncbi:MAG: hypothetical protein KBB70_00425 [Candidatus Pacebacteria bacterium]|jgi:hypothetical protein|nr:hypothetical protein [Candidatus Paceibacterota bacterium]